MPIAPTITQDNLDYHPSMQAYFQAKMRLFNERLKTDGVAVINTRDMPGIQIAAGVIREIIASM